MHTYISGLPVFVEPHPSIGISTNIHFLKEKASGILENLEAD